MEQSRPSCREVIEHGRFLGWSGDGEVYELRGRLYEFAEYLGDYSIYPFVGEVDRLIETRSAA